jgi:hypothetical protein
MPPKPDTIATSFLAGGFADFLVFLSDYPQPLVVGAGYPRHRLAKAFQDWAAKRNFSTDNADIASWRFACEHGHFKGST